MYRSPTKKRQATQQRRERQLTRSSYTGPAFDPVHQEYQAWHHGRLVGFAASQRKAEELVADHVRIYDAPTHRCPDCGAHFGACRCNDPASQVAAS